MGATVGQEKCFWTSEWSHCASTCPKLIPSRVLDAMTVTLSPYSSRQLWNFKSEQAEKKRLSTLCDHEHLLCLVKYLQQRIVGGWGQWMVSDLSANNLSEDNVAGPPMPGSLLLEGIWSCSCLGRQRGEGLWQWWKKMLKEANRKA